FMMGKAREGRGNVDIERCFPNPFEQSFDDAVDIGALDEGHLDVDLCELKLAICPLVFVPKTPRELIIPLHTCDDENLFELLRRLGQSVKGARFTAIRHEELPRAFGGALEKDWRLQFQKALLIEEQSRGSDIFAARTLH